MLGGGPWTQGPLYCFLRNRLYRGDISHKGKSHPGLHPAIVDEQLFNLVQQKLGSGREQHQHRHTVRASKTLAGRIYDDRGHRMSPVSARRNGRIHRYYVSQALLRGDRGVPGSLPRVPAEAVHALVDRELQARVDPAKAGHDLKAALVKVVVADKAVELTLDPIMANDADGRDPASRTAVLLRIPAILKTFGGAQQMMDETGAPIQLTGPDRALQKAIARARRWARQIEAGERTGADDIAAAEDLQSRYVDWILRLAWLAPDIVEAILSGRRLRDFTLTELITTEMPVDWRHQREMLVLV